MTKREQRKVEVAANRVAVAFERLYKALYHAEVVLGEYRVLVGSLLKS